jgi:ADP-ribose pyrophosphatase
LAYSGANRTTPVRTARARSACDELQYLYFASDLHPRKLQQDEDEWIEVVRLSPRQVERAIASGRIGDSKTISAFFLARQKRLIP